MKQALVFPVIFLLSLSGRIVQAQCGVPDPEAEPATGVVFSDENGNRLRDSGENGVAGVKVSNGCDVVATDSRGRYRINLAPMEILFISKPANYDIAVDENNIPRFFYRHYPSGTPAQIAGTSVAWLWPVIEATGPLPDSIDFPLRPRVPSPSFTAHGFADTQARYELSQDMLREDLINPLIGNPYAVDFGLTVGDVVYDNLAIYDRHKEMMGLMDIPQWYLPGNHDINYESPNSLFANETYKKHFGPTYYSFNHGNVHFVALNNVEYAGAGREFDSGRYRGHVTANQLYWLERDLADVPRDKLIVNLFDGGARDRVELALDGRAPEPMRYTVRTDPFVERVHAHYRETDDSYGRATRSSHIWEYDLPDAMAPGLHRVEVFSEDEFGQRFQGRFSFELDPRQ